MSEDSKQPASPMLHMIGNAHLDPVWLWRWQEGCAEAIGTCWAAIDRLEESDGFLFSKGEAQVYQWIEELDPALFERIRHFVAGGRWVVVNGWWIQPDCNVPSGESVIRDALYGKRYFKSRFGIDVDVGYNVDSFGHAGTFPMLLRHTGSSKYVFSRPAEDEMGLPQELFTWVSPDGSEVTAFRIQGAYNTSRRNMQVTEKVELHYDLSSKAGHSYMAFYGVGNHGGAPTKAELLEIDRRIAAGEPLKYSDPSIYFAEMASETLPRIEGELQFHAVGCYAVASDLKQLNRRAESILEQAETAATLATLHAGAAYPRAAFEAMWRRLLFNQFHDTLGGTSLHTACEDSVFELGAVIADAEVELNASARRLAALIAPPQNPSDGTFVVFNFNGADHDGLIEAEPWVDKDIVSKRTLRDDEDRVVPIQYVDPYGKTPGLQRLAFRAQVPAFGYRVYRFAIDETGESAPDMVFGHRVDILDFETAGYRLGLDPQSGAIASLVSKRTGSDIFAGPAHRGLIVNDPTDTWGHGTHSFSVEGDDLVLETVTMVAEGPIETVIEVTASRGETRCSTVIVLPSDADLPVELRVTLDWREKHKLFRFAYPLAADTFEYEVPAGWQARSDVGHEVPGLRWVRAIGPDHIVVIANDAKYSYAAKDGTLFITAVRSPVFSHHEPIKLREDAYLRYMDQGPRTFTIRVCGDSEVTRRQAHVMSDNLTKPPLVTTHVTRHGTCPHAGTWLGIDADEHTVVSTIKTAEDTDDLIVRVLELDGVTGGVTYQAMPASIGPYQIATFRLRDERLIPSDGLES